MRNPIRFLILTVVSLSLILASTAAKAEKGTQVDVLLGQSTILTLNDPPTELPVERVSITDDKIAGIQVFKPVLRADNTRQQDIQVNGKALGYTTLIVWEKNGKKTLYDIKVEVDKTIPTTDLKKKINEIAPGDAVNLEMINANTLVVTGSVSTELRRVKIHDLLLGFGKDITEKDLYVLQGGVTKETRPAPIADEKGYKFVMLVDVLNNPQVMLQITVASIDRTAMRNLGINVFQATKDVALFSTGSSASPFSSIANLISGSQFGPSGTTGTTSSSSSTTGTNFNVTNNPNFGVIYSPSGTGVLIKALSSKGLAKILAEPNLIVNSGQTGEFHAGGSFPVPSVQNIGSGGNGNNAVSIVFQEYGVILKFKPLVTEEGVIILDLDSQVSSIDESTAVIASGFSIPGLKIDRVATSAELKDGEGFVIAGLINDEWSKNLQKFPILGDIPILGAFFREQSMTKEERELIFVVTPKLMKPMPKGQTPDLPGANEPTKQQNEDLRWIPMLPTSRALDPEKLQ